MIISHSPLASVDYRTIHFLKNFSFKGIRRFSGFIGYCQERFPAVIPFWISMVSLLSEITLDSRYLNSQTTQNLCPLMVMSCPSLSLGLYHFCDFSFIHYSFCQFTQAQKHNRNCTSYQNIRTSAYPQPILTC